jgi:Fe-S-cluster containining protein
MSFSCLEQLFNGQSIINSGRKVKVVQGYKYLIVELWKRGCFFVKMKEDLLKNWEKKSGDRQKEYKKFLNRANKNRVLKQLPDLNEEAFSKIDCLQCGNCCKSYSPRFTPPDIKRISKYLGMKEGDFRDKYLRVDDDGDNVLQQLPCSFLGADNYCSIYEVRPTDCARFPYMDDDFMLKRQPLALKNSSFCPITYYVFERLIENLK